MPDAVTLNDNLTVTIGDPGAEMLTVSINLNDYKYASKPYIYSSSAETTSFANVNFDSLIIEKSVPFENGFPAWHDFQEMCKEYPGLDKAVEHLRIFYNLCRNEWEEKKRNND